MAVDLANGADCEGLLYYDLKAGLAGGLRPPSGRQCRGGHSGTGLTGNSRRHRSLPCVDRVIVTQWRPQSAGHPKQDGAQKSETHTPASDSTSQYLESLRDAYIYKVNAALERGREDLAAELADDYLAEVRSLMGAGSHPRG